MAQVTVMFTVLAMDAGPIVSQREIVLTGDESAPELLDHLFEIGAEEVLAVMPSIFDRSVQVTKQDHDKATHAPKMSKEEGRTVFAENAERVHNKVKTVQTREELLVRCFFRPLPPIRVKLDSPLTWISFLYVVQPAQKVRAFAEWPGLWAEFIITDKSGQEEEIRLKLVKTRVHRAEGQMALGVHEIDVNAVKDALRIVCDDGSVLDVINLQPQGRNVSKNDTKNIHRNLKFPINEIGHRHGDEKLSARVNLSTTSELEIH